LRYHRVILMTDADVDGAHIRTLLMTLFYRYFPQLITGGHVYIAQPPLFSVRRGKDIRWIYNEEALEKTLKEMEAATPAAGKTVKPVKADKEAVEVTIKRDGSVDGLAAEIPDEEAGMETVQSRIPGVSIQRYKGLGEMNADQLWDTTMDPTLRVMRQVTLDDAEKADEVFDILMGADVAPRKRFIHTQAKYVKNLDI
jgi:DNA gyrase subunit B